MKYKDLGVSKYPRNVLFSTPKSFSNSSSGTKETVGQGKILPQKAEY